LTRTLCPGVVVASPILSVAREESTIELCLWVFLKADLITTSGKNGLMCSLEILVLVYLAPTFRWAFLSRLQSPLESGATQSRRNSKFSRSELGSRHCLLAFPGEGLALLLILFLLAANRSFPPYRNPRAEVKSNLSAATRVSYKNFGFVNRYPGFPGYLRLGR